MDLDSTRALGRLEDNLEAPGPMAFKKTRECAQGLSPIERTFSSPEGEGFQPSPMGTLSCRKDPSLLQSLIHRSFD